MTEVEANNIVRTRQRPMMPGGSRLFQCALRGTGLALKPEGERSRHTSLAPSEADQYLQNSSEKSDTTAISMSQIDDDEEELDELTRQLREQCIMSMAGHAKQKKPQDIPYGEDNHSLPAAVQSKNENKICVQAKPCALLGIFHMPEFKEFVKRHMDAEAQVDFEVLSKTGC
uniref:Protein phosphatase inhibitor 2 n=1 Tax=Steinernema glaseri TaxID=37863 RepID=A0A1I7YC13_9BILA